jgi:hypothetical protein
MDMENSIFKKMKVKTGMTAVLLNIPPEYPDYTEFINFNDEKSEFVHLFVKSKAEFMERFVNATDAVVDGGLIWLSYPKSVKKQKYDINRDSLWHLLLSEGYHPVSQVSLDDNWSAVRAKKNEAGITYEPPSSVKKHMEHS